MRFIILCAALSFLFSCGQNADKKKEPAEKDTATTTDTVAKTVAIKDTLIPYTAPGESSFNEALAATSGNKWHVLNDKEATWMKDVFEYFIIPKRKENPDYPYITKGDFNADGKPDMAAIVTDGSKNNYQVAVILGGNKILFWEEDIMDDAAISTVPKSTIEGMDGEKTKKVKLKGDGINVEYFEKASFVLYWDKASFKRIQTGD